MSSRYVNVINLNVVSSFNIFNEFDYVLGCVVSLNKLNFNFNKKKSKPR